MITSLDDPSSLKDSITISTTIRPKPFKSLDNKKTRLFKLHNSPVNDEVSENCYRISDMTYSIPIVRRIQIPPTTIH